MSTTLALPRPVAAPSLVAGLVHAALDLLARVIAGPCDQPRKALTAHQRIASFTLGLLAFMPLGRTRRILARIAAEFVGPWVLMAAGAWTFTNGSRTSLLNGTFDLDTDTFLMALYLSTSDLGAASTTYAGVTNQHANANGYTTGGNATALSLSGTTTVTVDDTDEVWTAAGGSITARFAALYESGGNILCYCLLDDTPADVTATDGNTLTVTIHASGVFTLA
jgi:hypothetical protein